MGYALNPATGKLEPITTVTGVIHVACGCRLRYDDTNTEHRRVRLDHDGLATCGDHGLQTVTGGAYSGPPELLIPDPVERREFEEDVMRDHMEEPYDDRPSDDESDATLVT